MTINLIFLSKLLNINGHQFNQDQNKINKKKLHVKYLWQKLVLILTYIHPTLGQNNSKSLTEELYS